MATPFGKSLRVSTDGTRVVTKATRFYELMSYLGWMERGTAMLATARASELDGLSVSGRQRRAMCDV
eukprot:scaffold27829_cov64-Cyclotella_meneghiniana.AAC.3